MNINQRNNCIKKDDGWHSILGNDHVRYNREDPEIINRIHQTVLDVMEAGGGIVQVCVALDIAISTFHEWRKKHADFKAVCAKGELLCVDSWDTIGKDGIDRKFFNDRLYTRIRTNKHYKYFSEKGRPKINEFSKCKTAGELGDVIKDALAAGRIDPDEALKISQAFCNMASLKERTELEARLVEVEKHQEKK